MTTVTIKGFTPDDLKKLEAGLLARHDAQLTMDPTGSRGVLTSHGVTANVGYLQDGSLQFDIKHPWYMSDAQVRNALVENVDNVLGRKCEVD